MRRLVGPWQWRIHSDWRHLFDDPNCPDWLRLEHDPRAVLVKANDGRQVWRVEHEEHLVFVKVGRPGRRWARFRRIFMGADSAREWTAAQYAAEHGIDTVRPIAIAEAPLNGRHPFSILITAGIPRAIPLNEYWSRLESEAVCPPAAAGQQRSDEGAPGSASVRIRKNQVIDVVARLIANAHQGGFEHFDLHAGNVLISERSGTTAPSRTTRTTAGLFQGPLPGNPFQAFFVDLNNVRTGRAVSDAAVAGNLAQFNQWFRLHATLTDRVRFLNRYLCWRHASKGAYRRQLGWSRRELLRRLQKAAIRHAEALYSKRDRRAMRSGRYFAKLWLKDGWRAHVYLECKHPVKGSRASRTRISPEQWARWLARPLEWITLADQRRLIKDSNTATVCRAQLPVEGAEPLEVVCKQTQGRDLFKRLHNLVRQSRPMLTWKRGNALLHRQIPTARPLAVIERRRFGLVLDSILITEYIRDANDLDTLLTVEMREWPPAQQRRMKLELMDSLLGVMQRLVDRGFTHRDFKAPNIIVQWSAASSKPPRILLIDLDGVRRSRRPAAGAMRMLMRLNVSLDHCRRVTLSDRLRFLKRYLYRPGNPEVDWKPVWQQLARMSERKRIVRTRSQERKFRKYGRF